MKCDFCTWDMLPENIPTINRHAEANHPDVETFFIVWRDGELRVARDHLETDTDLHVEIRNPFPLKKNLLVMELEDPDYGEEREMLSENAVNEDEESVI